MSEAPSAQRMARFERSLARIRWFGIALGVYQVSWYEPIAGSLMPPSARVIAGTGLGLLTAMNLTVWLVARRDPGERAQRVLGAAVFACDAAAVWTIVWAFNFERFGSTWVILVILCLEGAQRYRLRGAMLPVALAVPIETAREAFVNAAFGYGFSVSGVTFRVGFMAIVASVAGVMARTMQRERAQAEERAVALADLADREADARRESAAFQDVILAGVSAATLSDALQSMVDHVATDLGYERVVVLLIEEDGRLHPIAARGFSARVMADSVALGEGISGRVALTGRSEIVPDVSRDPGYYRVEDSTRSQITVPISAGERIVGAIDVESERLDAYDERDRSRLERLGAQMGLVVEQARLLAQERATVERLRELDLMKSDFVAIASHELRTPLTAMKGSIRTLRRTDVSLTPHQVEELYAVLDRQTERLSRLVEDLLLASRIDAGGVTLQPEPLDVPETCRAMLEEIGPRAARVSIAMPPSLPRVVTDGHRLWQVVRNLVDNALKFSPEDTLVRVSLHYDHATLLIEVSDEGRGIPAPDLPRIFERFHQVGSSLRRHGDGFGLGLYIAKRLVEAMGGRIDVDSAEGRGTTFRVWVPAPPGRAASAEQTA